MGPLIFLLQQLTIALRDHKDLKSRAKHEFEQLKDELLLMKAFLNDAARVSEKEDVFRQKEMEISELVYDVQDTIDVCLTKKAAVGHKNIVRRRLLEIFSRDIEQKVKLLRKRRVTPMVNDIKKKFLPIEVKKDQYMGDPAVTLVHGQSTGEQSTGESSSSHAQSDKQDGVVEFEEEATIIGYLMEPKAVLDIIAISGMAGSGKTTLAGNIFQKEEIRLKFPLRIWIRVSQKFKSRDVFMEILEKFKTYITPTPQGMPIPQGMASLSEETLIGTVRVCLTSYEFLLVMDDVWTIEDWDAIEKILPKKNGKGKVLVTSRHKNVAEHASNIKELLHLNPLKPHKSLELLKLTVFGDVGAYPSQLEDIGQAIANRCCGVPLIIVVIGGVLKRARRGTTPSLHGKWLDVLKDVDKILLKGNSISDALELSYNILPDDLRACFLYTGLFPQNFEIPASTLTQLWIAEGFIQREDGLNFEQSAEKILDDLINMNLLSVKKKNLDKVKTCGVHDMVREFCKAKAKQKNFFRVVMKSEHGVIDPLLSDGPNIRRLCLHSNLSVFLDDNPKGPRVRSFLCFLDEPLDSKHASTLRAFNLLRVLSCKPITFQQFPNVKKLYLLKHISLSIQYLNALPKQISKLINLQTLIVITNSRSIEVKANIWKMMELRCLNTKATISLNGKKWEGKSCKNLQKISRLSPESCRSDLYQMAPNLKILGIQGKLAYLFDRFSLEKYSHLEKLKLVNVPESPYDVPYLGCTRSVKFSPSLKRLTLSKTHLKWPHCMPILAKINTLKVLKLKDNAFIGDTWKVDDGEGFSGLQFLLIENSMLCTWTVSATHFQSLTSLVLKRCKYLKEIPECLGENLEMLEIEGVPMSVADSARKIESNIKQLEESGRANWRSPLKLTIGPDCVLVTNS